MIMQVQTKEACPVINFVLNYECEFCYMSHNSNFLKRDVCYGQFLSKLSLRIQLLDYWSFIFIWNIDNENVKGDTALAMKWLIKRGYLSN